MFAYGNATITITFQVVFGLLKELWCYLVQLDKGSAHELLVYRDCTTLLHALVEGVSKSGWRRNIDITSGQQLYGFQGCGRNEIRTNG